MRLGELYVSRIRDIAMEAACARDFKTFTVLDEDKMEMLGGIS
jgi:hypothetical protein